MISPLKRGVDSDVRPVEMTGKTCEKGSKIVFFGRNGVVRISTLQEKLLLISPVRLILYTDTLKLFFFRHVKINLYVIYTVEVTIAYIEEFRIKKYSIARSFVKHFFQ